LADRISWVILAMCDGALSCMNIMSFSIIQMLTLRQFLKQVVYIILSANVCTLWVYEKDTLKYQCG
jgi:hypothetical protein